jgi:rSAM/selenodomain-associated transferase 2
LQGAPKTISVIVPILDELAVLPRLMEHLAELRQQGCEVLLVDGGSSDGSVEMARAGGFSVLERQPGRGRQMNAGASAASGDILLFLHADTRLPEGAIFRVRCALESGRSVWGRFDVRIDGRSSILAVVAAMMNGRSRLTGIATGDHAMFVRRDVFVTIGGFPEQPLMEDIEISRRLRRHSWPIRIASRVVTSGRRWEQCGVWQTILLMWWLRFAYWCGASATALARRYR